MNTRNMRDTMCGNKHGIIRVSMRILQAAIITVFATVFVVLVGLTTAHAASVDDPNYYVKTDLSFDINQQTSELNATQGFKFYIHVNTQGQESPDNYNLTVTMPADAVQQPNIPSFSDQWGGLHTISTPTKDAQGNWVFTIHWDHYNATSAVAIPVSIDWVQDTPKNYKLPISVQYQSDQQPLTKGEHVLQATYTYGDIHLDLRGPSTQQGATTYSTTASGVKYIDPTDMAPVVFTFSASSEGDMRRVSKYDICDILPTYQGADGKQHTAQLSSQSQKDGWKLSADGTQACFTADSSNDKYNEIAVNHSLIRSIPQYSIGLNFPYLPMTGTTGGDPSTNITNQAYVKAYANNSQDTLVQQSNIASTSKTIVVAGFVRSAGPGKSAPADFTESAARVNNPLEWTINWTNTSNVSADHIELYDRSPVVSNSSTTDKDGKLLTNDSRFKIVGVKQIYVRPLGNYWWPNTTGMAQAGKTVIEATTADGTTDPYPVTWSSDSRTSLPVTFDAKKTYVSVHIIAPEQFALQYGEQINAIVQTQWEDAKSISYDKADTQKNTFTNNTDFTAKFSSTEKTSVYFGWSHAQTHLLAPPAEKLTIHAFAYNSKLTVDKSNPLLIYEVRAFLDPNKDYKDLRVLAPIPTGFTMTGTHNQNAYGLPSTWNKTFVDSWEIDKNYKGTGQDYIIFHINQQAAKEAFQLVPQGSMWIEVNGKADFAKSFSGNDANKVVGYFTADNAPVQNGTDGQSVVTDELHFGPNKDIVYSMGAYTTMNAQGDSFTKGLFGSDTAARTSQGQGATNLQIEPGRTVYWALSYNNSSGVVRKDLRMFDTAPAVGDVMPVGGQQRGSDFAVNLVGKVHAVSYSFTTGKTTDIDPSTLTITYTTDPRATKEPWKTVIADTSVARIERKVSDPNIPWNEITAFRIDFGDVPEFTRVRLILPTAIAQDIGAEDAALRAKGAIKSVNAAAFSVDDRDPIQTLPSSVSTSFGSFHFKKTDRDGKAIQAATMQLTGTVTGWDGDKNTFGSGKHTYSREFNNVDHIDFEHMPAGHYTLRETKANDEYRNTTWIAKVNVSYKENDTEFSGTPAVSITCVDTAKDGEKSSGGCQVSGDGTTVTFINDEAAPLHSMPYTGGWQFVALVGANVMIVLMLGVGIVRALSRD